MSRNIKYVDLFCGLGAFHQSFNNINKIQKKINYKCVFACDINKDIQKLYLLNYGIKPYGDINKINFSKLQDFDILCAGFPCQPFSIAGKKEGFKNKNKGNLFYKILELIDEKSPKILFFENVKNLKTIHKGETFNIIKNEIEKRGYIFNYNIIDSKYYNCPQSRKRIYIICSKYYKYKFNKINNKIIPVSTIIDFTNNNYFNYKDKYSLVKSNGKGMMKYKLINNKTGRGGRQGERVYDISTCGPTICASSGGPGSNTGLYEINNKIRKLNVNETLKMFGFNVDYKYQCISNKKMLNFLGNSIVINVLQKLILNFKFSNGKETAINGLKEEKLVCKNLNENLELKKKIYEITNISYNSFYKIKGNSKTDISSNDNNILIQVKKYKKKQFQQVARYWTTDVINNIPKLNNIKYMLTNLCEYPLLPNKEYIDKNKSIKKLNNDHYSNKEINQLLQILNNNKKLILQLAFYGYNQKYQPKYILGVEYIKSKRHKIIFLKIENIIEHLIKYNFKIKKSKTVISLGNIFTIQRKGGDSGRKSSNQLQFKIIISSLNELSEFEYLL